MLEQPKAATIRALFLPIRALFSLPAKKMHAIRSATHSEKRASSSHREKIDLRGKKLFFDSNAWSQEKDKVETIQKRLKDLNVGMAIALHDCDYVVSNGQSQTDQKPQISQNTMPVTVRSGSKRCKQMQEVMQKTSGGQTSAGNSSSHDTYKHYRILYNPPFSP